MEYKSMDTFDYIMVKDPHFMFGFRNNIRKHGWEKAIDDKLSQIISYALENNVKNIFFTGDVFEKSKRKDWNLSQLQQNKLRLKRFKDAGLTVYSNMGNHDYFDGFEGPEGTIFGEMMELGLINYVGSGQFPVKFNLGNTTIGLFGIDHHQTEERVLDEMQRIESFPEVDLRVILMHSNVTDSNTRLTDFTYNQLSRFNIDIINCGHWHLEPENGSIQEVNKTHFLNPWNLTRVMRDYNVKLDEHKPSFIHCNIILESDVPKITFVEVPIKVLPFSEAFQVEVINILQELGKSGFQFFEEIDLEQDDELSDDDLIMDAIAKANKISEQSVQIAKDLLS